MRSEPKPLSKLNHFCYQDPSLANMESPEGSYFAVDVVESLLQV